MIEKKIEWKPGWSRHTLFAIEEVVCKDCLVGFMCDMVCLNYRTVHGAMMAWIQGCHYDVTRAEFNERISDAMELME